MVDTSWELEQPSTLNSQPLTPNSPNYLKNGLLRFSRPMVVSGPWPE
jgi:hypothetical protein